MKILDFGLASRQSPLGELNGGATTLTRVTQPGTVLGTVGYMAPEQVRGETADSRADIFSFGCVLYEMITGERAFARSTAVETLTAILRDAPPGPSARRRELPSGLERVIAHCLEKEASARFQSAHDLEFALIALVSGSTAAGSRPSSACVAVPPFLNLSADPENEFFADGITEDVIAHLAKMRSLKVISRTSVMAFKKRDCSLREIGERLGASSLLEGSVRKAGKRVRIVAQLIDAASDKHIWAETYDRDLTDIFAIQTDVALNIANALRAELSNDERERVERRPTHDLEAYELYLRGRDSLSQFTKEGFRRSLVEFNAAVSRDPNFALAWASIARVQVEICINGALDTAAEETIRSAKRAAARALELDSESGDAQGIYGLIQFAFDFDWEGAERSFLKAIELSPGSVQVHEHYSWLCASLERYDDAIREVRRARELDPIMIHSDVANTLLRAGRVEEALEEGQRPVQRQPGVPRCHSVLGWAQIFHGEKAAGIASLEKAAALSPDSTIFLSQLGQACALTGAVKERRPYLSS